MKDSTVIRLAEVAAGCFVLYLHVSSGQDTILIAFAALLVGVPLEILYERRQKK